MSGLEIDWKVIVAQTINFAILFFVLRFFLYKPFLNLLQKRKERIEMGINKSIEAEKKLSKLSEIKKRIEERGEEDRRKILIDSENEAKRRQEELLQKTEKEKEAILVKAQKDAEEIKEKEKEQTKKQVVENAFALTEELLKHSIDEKKGKEIANEFLSKMKL